MGIIIYYFLTKFYFWAISISALFSSKAGLFKKGRSKLFLRLEQEIKEKPGKYVWFHCASLGEFEQGRPVIEAFKSKLSEYKILLTFFSPSGYEIRKSYQHADLIFYLPEDTPNNAQKFLELVKPELVLFIKYEFWYFFIREINKRQIPLISVSSIFRKEQIFFKFYGGFFRKMLNSFTYFFVQDQDSGHLLRFIGINKVSINGDTRFDRVAQISKTVKTFPAISEFVGDSQVLVAGSVWREDLQVLLPLARENKHLKIIIAPHEIHESFLSEITSGFPECTRYTMGFEKDKQTLVIDSIGLLSSLYQFAHYAFVGGAYGKGLHNILEAATFGMPIFFGDRNYKKFVEAIALQKLGVAFPVASYDELKERFTFFENNARDRLQVSQVCKNFVIQNTGASDRILKYSSKLLKEQKWKEEF